MYRIHPGRIHETYHIFKEDVMKKKIVTVLLATALTMAMVTGCGSKAASDTADTTEATDEADSTEDATDATDAEATDAEDDQAKADEAAALIDAIYVQERTDKTDALCQAA